MQTGRINGESTLLQNGFKQSGVGRQNGIAGFDQYVEITSLARPTPTA